MAAIRLRLRAAHAEAGFAMAGYAASSAYWLALAFALSADAYGRMMTIQAAVLMVVSALTFRTHDLFFNLVTQHAQPPQRAYRIARRCEALAAALATVAISVGAAFVYAPEANLTALLGTMGFALLASVGANQGAAIGSLRQIGRGDVIARTEAVTAAAWGLACLSIVALRDAPVVVPLIVGAAPPSLRAILLAGRVRALSWRQAAGPLALQRSETKTLMRFLGGAQITNFLKNGAVSIETLILAAFASPAVVAMYRVARAALGATLAALNVAYQRAYPVLAKAGSVEQRRTAMTGLRRRSLAICLVTYPLAAALALGYALLKPGVGVVELQLLTAGTFLALVPAALQQGAFALLSLRGDHRSANTAYLLWFGVIGLGALLLTRWPAIEVFMAAIIAAALARLWYFAARARATSGMVPAVPSTDAAPGAAPDVAPAE